MTPLTKIPGIGRTFAADFHRIGIPNVEALVARDPQPLYAALQDANQAVGHKTSKNYLYVLRMAVYYASGGRNPEQLTWSAWADAVDTNRPRRKK
jgi:hypothetical protein